MNIIFLSGVVSSVLTYVLTDGATELIRTILNDKRARDNTHMNTHMIIFASMIHTVAESKSLQFATRGLLQAQALGNANGGLIHNVLIDYEPQGRTLQIMSH